MNLKEFKTLKSGDTLYINGVTKIHVEWIRKEDKEICYYDSNECCHGVSYKDVTFEQSEAEKRFDKIIDRIMSKINWDNYYVKEQCKYYYEQGIRRGLRIGFKMKKHLNKK